MTNFSVIDILVKVFDDLFSYIDVNHKFMCEVPESSMNSTEDVNTLVGISGDIEGNIMFGYTDKTAELIASKLIGSKDVEVNSIYVKAALADFYSEFCRRFTNAVKLENLFNLSGNQKDYALLSSNPTYISGKDMFGVISKVPSKKLFFKVDGEKFGIAYSLEQK